MSEHRKKWLTIAITFCLVLPTMSMYTFGTYDGYATQIDESIPLEKGGVHRVVVKVRWTPRLEHIMFNHDMVLSELKAEAAETQAPVIAYLQQKDDAKVLNTFWLTNLILIEADVSTIRELATFPSVNKIIDNFVVTIPENEVTDFIVSGNSTTWNIEHVRAPEVWEVLGVTGEGIRIATTDTGIDITHPDLVGTLWTDNPADPTYPGGWIEYDSNGNIVPGSVPHDTHGHGTATYGIVVGQATGPYGPVGMAPDAIGMHALNVPYGYATVTQLVAGLQWVIDPVDQYGNPAGAPAQVSSHSWRPWPPGYYDEFIEPIRNMWYANHFVVAAIGNEYEGSSGSPGNVYETIGVGATDINDYVASWSSGEWISRDDWTSPPEDWPRSYVKPDLSAPGDNVIVPYPGNQYIHWSGTSFASPHVGGAAVLMLSANPTLTPAQIEDALKWTAVYYDHYYSTRPDARYGWGRIDAYEATLQVLRHGYCWREISHTWTPRVSTTPIAVGDDRGTWVSLPWSFMYFREGKSRVYVCSNGFLIFDPTPATNDWSNSLSELKTRCMIAPFWDDLRTDRAGGIVSTPGVYVDYHSDDPYSNWNPDADVNNDGVVDDEDLDIVLDAYGSKPGDPNWDPRADINGDGIVDLLDLVIVCIHYGSVCSIVVFTWEATRYGDASDSIKFQAVLFRDGTIRIAINGATNFADFSPTIGISKRDGAGWYNITPKSGTSKTWLLTYDHGCFMWERPGTVGYWPWQYVRKGSCLMIPGGYEDPEGYGECGCGPVISRNYAPDYWYPYWGSYYLLSDIEWYINQYSDAQSITGHSYCYVSEFRIATDYGDITDFYSTLPNAEFYIGEKGTWGGVMTREGEIYTRTPEQIAAGTIYWADAYFAMTTGTPKECTAYEYEMKIDDWPYYLMHPGGYPLDWWKRYWAPIYSIERPHDCEEPPDILSITEFPGGFVVALNASDNTIVIRTTSGIESKNGLDTYIDSRSDALDDLIERSEPEMYIPVTITFNEPLSPSAYISFCKRYKLESAYYRFISKHGSGISTVRNPEQPFRWDFARNLEKERGDKIIGVTAVYGLIKVESAETLRSNTVVLLVDPKEDLIVQEYISLYTGLGEEILVEYPDDIWVEYELYG